MSSAILFIEMQNEWLDATGRIRHLMADGAQFAVATEGARALLAGARERRARIAHAGLGFQPGHPELGTGGTGLRAAIRQLGTFPESTPASDFAPGFEPAEGEFVVRGRIGASAFSGSNLDGFLRNNGIRRLYVAGLALHVCVLATAWAAHDLGYEVVLVADATAAFTPGQRQVVLDDIAPHIGEVQGVQAVLAALGTPVCR